MGDTKKLTIKQEDFCIEYLKSGDASKAYRIAYKCPAGKSQKSVYQRATNLVKQENIQAYLKLMRKDVVDQAAWDIDQATTFLKEIVSNELEKTADRITAIKELNNIYGLHREQVDINVNQVKTLDDFYSDIETVEYREVSNETNPQS